MIRDVCYKSMKAKNYQTFSNSYKHKHNSGQIRKIHCSVCNFTLFRKAIEKLLNSDKHLFTAGHLFRSDKCPKYC